MNKPGTIQSKNEIAVSAGGDGTRKDRRCAPGSQVQRPRPDEPVVVLPQDTFIGYISFIY